MKKTPDHIKVPLLKDDCDTLINLMRSEIGRCNDEIDRGQNVKAAKNDIAFYKKLGDKIHFLRTEKWPLL
jgi:hypothetical protein